MGNTDSSPPGQLTLSDPSSFNDLYSSSLILDINKLSQSQFDNMMFNHDMQTFKQPNSLNI